VPPEKVFNNIQRYGNTTAASIPIALDEAIETGRVQNGNTVVFLALGAGLTWGAVIYRFADESSDRSSGNIKNRSSR
jgi:3-oxoacyl-[acyl-carrier-protein] synthase-3